MNRIAGDGLETSKVWWTLGLANHSRRDPPANCTHAYFSYERLDYHISWSPFRQHSRIRELDSQIARQGVSPDNVGWAPVLFWTGLAEDNLVRYKCRNDESKCADLYFGLVDMRDKGMILCERGWFEPISRTFRWSTKDFLPGRP